MAVTPRDPATVPGLDGRSRWIDLDGPLHYLDLGGPAGAPVVVCVHGLSGSAVNWSAIAPLLTDRYRLLAPDLAGHGLTRSVGRGTTVSANRILLHRFLESMPGTPVILMGNSMGGLISLLEAANAPGAVSGLILISPVLPIVPARPDPAVTAMLMAYATPGLGQLLMVRRRRLSPEALVRSTMSLCCADPSRVPATVIAEHVAVARQRARTRRGRYGCYPVSATCPSWKRHRPSRRRYGAGWTPTPQRPAAADDRAGDRLATAAFDRVRTAAASLARSTSSANPSRIPWLSTPTSGTASKSAVMPKSSRSR